MRGNGLTAAAYTAVSAVDHVQAGDALLALREIGVAAYVVLDDHGTVQVFADRDAVPEARRALRDLVAEPHPGPGPDTEPVGEPSADPSGDPRADEAWEQIVAGYDESAAEPPGQWSLPSRITIDPEPPPQPPPPPRARPTPTDDLDSEATWDDEGHFVPPPAPPVPRGDLVTRLSWCGLVGGPLLMLVAVVFGLGLPTEVLMVCLLGFVGGLVTLIVRMNDRGDGSDGAVL
ncbi:MAG: hypothetical protein ACRDQF_14345 [Thermocrispum sp.]